MTRDVWSIISRHGYRHAYKIITELHYYINRSYRVSEHSLKRYLKRVLSQGHSRHFRGDYHRIIQIVEKWIIEYVTKHTSVSYNYSWRTMVIRKKGYWGQRSGGLDKMNIKLLHQRRVMMRIYNMIKNDRAYTHKVLYNIFYWMTYRAKRTNYYHLNKSVKKLCKSNGLHVHVNVVSTIENYTKQRILWDNNGENMRGASRTWKAARDRSEERR